MAASSGRLEVSVGFAGRWALVRVVALPLSQELVIGRSLFGGDPGVGSQHVVLESAGDRLRVRVNTRRPTAVVDGDRLRPLASGSVTELPDALLRSGGIRLGLGSRFLKLASSPLKEVDATAAAPDLVLRFDGDSFGVDPAQRPTMGLAQAVVALVTASVAEAHATAQLVAERALGAALSIVASAPAVSSSTFTGRIGRSVVAIVRDPAEPPFSDEERRVCEQVVAALRRAAGEAQERGPSDAATSGADGQSDEAPDPSRRVQRWFDDYLGGTSPAVTAFHEDLARIAADIGRRLGDAGAAPVLLLSGEPGVGKDRAAGALHAVFRRLNGRPGPFVAVNLAAIPDSLAEAELFGMAPSAATGVKERAGAFERAQGGTIFLNEVDKCPLPLQAKLLTVLEARRVTRVGGGDEREVDAIVIAANNGRMPDLVREGVVIQPLADRLGVPLEVPPLRERGRDLEAYATAFLAARGVGSPIAEGVVRVLAQLSWPGNVRQLKNVIDRVCQLARFDPRSISRIHDLTMPSKEVTRTAASESEPRYRALFDRYLALGRSDAALAAECAVDERTVRNWKRRWRELGLS